MYLHHCIPVFHTLNLTFNAKTEDANDQNYQNDQKLFRQL